MAFVNYRANENSKKCESCRMNLINVHKIGDKGYMHFLSLDETLNKAILKSAQGAMWAACKLCPNRKDFEKMYGVEPVKYYSAVIS